jgi:hypothetical protein
VTGCGESDWHALSFCCDTKLWYEYMCS